MSAVEGNDPPRAAWRLYKRFAIAAAIIALSTAGAVATAGLLEVKDYATIIGHSAPIPGIKAPGILDNVNSGGPQTILLLGSDRRYGSGKGYGLSDTMILVRLDPSKGATAVMNIPRDLRVQIPGYGTNKINAAYSFGGPKLSVKTVKSLLATPGHPFPINHVVNINFLGFERAVNRVGCVYVDVDRHYFNDNNPPAGGGGAYSVIDVPAGYQRLCGMDSLSYVRFRHLDNDLVRAARQQDFVRQAKDQIGVSKLFSDRKGLLKIFADYTQTDIRGEIAILRLIKLAVESARNPVQEVHFAPVADSGNDLVATPATLATLASHFLDAHGSKGARGTTKKSAGDVKRARRQRRKSTTAGVPLGLFNDKQPGEDQAINLATGVHFPVYYPKLAVLGSSYVLKDSRAYKIKDRAKHSYSAYRIVVSAPGAGQYYGIQGTTWQAPPLLDNPTETRTIRGRDYELFGDGSRLRLIAWRTKNAVYWVSNTLLQSLTNAQMIGLATSLSRVGA